MSSRFAQTVTATVARVGSLEEGSIENRCVRQQVAAILQVPVNTVRLHATAGGALPDTVLVSTFDFVQRQICAANSVVHRQLMSEGVANADFHGTVCALCGDAETERVFNWVYQCGQHFHSNQTCKCGHSGRSRNICDQCLVWNHDGNLVCPGCVDLNRIDFWRHGDWLVNIAFFRGSLEKMKDALGPEGVCSYACTTRG